MIRIEVPEVLHFSDIAKIPSYDFIYYKIFLCYFLIKHTQHHNTGFLYDECVFYYAKTLYNYQYSLTMWVINVSLSIQIC